MHICFTRGGYKHRVVIWEKELADLFVPGTILEDLKLCMELRKLPNGECINWFVLVDAKDSGLKHELDFI